jgi:hypothetical protein
VDFLAREFEGVPEEVQKVALKQLEQTIREIHGRVTIHDTTCDIMTLHRMCGKIHAIVDFVQKFRRDLNDKDG